MSTIIWILEQISGHMTNVEQIYEFAHKTWVINYHIIPILEVNKTRDEIPQAYYTYTKKYEQCLEWDYVMLTLLCLLFLFIYLFILWFI